MTDKPTQSDAPSAEPITAKQFYHTYGVKVPDLYRFAEAYAALRTAQVDSQLKLTRVELKQSCEERERLLATERAKVAQLERELADEKQAHKETTDEFHVAADGRERWMERATAAESALSEARAQIAGLIADGGMKK